MSNSSARVVACESASDAGVGQINAAMMAHFSSQIEGEHGAGTCGTAKSKYRLSGAVERLKKNAINPRGDFGTSHSLSPWQGQPVLAATSAMAAGCLSPWAGVARAGRS